MRVPSVFSFLAIVVTISACNSVDFKKTKGGMPYKLFPGKGGQPVQPGNIIKAHITYKVKDSLLTTSYAAMPVYFPVTDQTPQPYDISELIPTLKKGDSVYAVQMMDSFIKKNPALVQQTPYRNGDKIEMTIKVLDVFKSQAEAAPDEEKERMAFLQKEDATVKSYLSKNNINAQKVGTGTYVEVLNPGTGAQADSGKYVSVMYKGSTFKGKVFDTNMDTSFRHTEPMGFVVGTSGMIKGFDEGIRLLKEGGRGRFYIPSTLAYGGQSPSPDIKPFEHLIFEVQIVDVQDKAPAPTNGLPQGAPDPTGGR